jgi:hypothetical protein
MYALYGHTHSKARAAIRTIEVEWSLTYLETTFLFESYKNIPAVRILAVSTKTSPGRYYCTVREVKLFELHQRTPFHTVQYILDIEILDDMPFLILG